VDPYGIRRFTRLINAFSEKWENHHAAIAAWFAFYNFCRVHKSIRVTPAMASEITDHIWGVREPLNAFIVRKQPKKHGLKRFIEGVEDAQAQGLPVVIIDDVCTQGNSTGEAIQKARSAGMKVLGAVCLVDREAGATELLDKDYDCKLESVFTLSELLAYHARHNISAEPVGARS
jgi:orotate phosphoribosyltransferase